MGSKKCKKKESERLKRKLQMKELFKMYLLPPPIHRGTKSFPEGFPPLGDFGHCQGIIMAGDPSRDPCWSCAGLEPVITLLASNQPKFSEKFFKFKISIRSTQKFFFFLLFFWNAKKKN